MTDTPARRLKAFLPFVLLGLVVAGAILWAGPEVQHAAPDRQGPVVETLEVQPERIRPTVTAYGEVQPDVLLAIRSEVAGKVTFRHPDLKKGALMTEGTPVIRVNDEDYQLALSKAQASLAQSRIRLEELQVTQADTRKDLALAREKLALAQRDLQRSEALHNQGAVSSSALEKQRTATLQQRQEVQSLENRLNTLPFQIDVQAAQIAIAESQEATQQHNLERTEIRLPFTGRVTEVSVESGEYVSPGTLLLRLQSIDRVQINSRVSLEQMKRLAEGGGDQRLSVEQLLAQKTPAINAALQNMGLEASLRLTGTNLSAQWAGTVERIESELDPKSRTLGLVVSVDDPYRGIQPGVKPPLFAGMYMQVALSAAPREVIAVPESALHNGEVYLLDEDNRLHRQVVSGHWQEGQFLISEGLEGGDRVITSPLFPAVEGMRLSPRSGAESSPSGTEQ